MKTTDAFAFRDFYYLRFENLKDDNLDAVINSMVTVFDFEGKKYPRPNYLIEPYELHRFENLISSIEYSQYVLLRNEFLIKILQNHLRRLNQLSVKIIEHFFDRSVDENLQKKITRLNFLNKAYKEILSLFHYRLDHQKEDLQFELKEFRTAMKEEFGKRLRTARKFKGYTGVELAKWLGISQTSYSEYERGKTEPPLSTIYVLAKKLNVTTDYLLCMDK